jgi:hypothetical protein
VGVGVGSGIDAAAAGARPEQQEQEEAAAQGAVVAGAIKGDNNNSSRGSSSGSLTPFPCSRCSCCRCCRCAMPSRARSWGRLPATHGGCSGYGMMGWWADRVMGGVGWTVR